ncbi:stress response protein NST1-like [Frieseomelitta varia]|uniref:stress response protein NST1-like n=1 Tax=Frieseomelitta varia TaxID=561572 RepID=UPI001CB67C7D|nr:stress response protein NST1-like [Frieseomelitta varia]
MPACEPWCPLVKSQLKKIEPTKLPASEVPWLLKKDFPSKETDLIDLADKLRDPRLDIIDEKFIRTKEVERDDDLEKEPEFNAAFDADLEKKPAPDVNYYRLPIETDRRLEDSVNEVTDREDPSKYRKIKRESATQWTVEGEDKVVETDIMDEPTIREEDLVVKLPERERLEHKKLEREKLERERLEDEKLEQEKIDGEPSKHDDIDERELAIFKDECDPSCPRRISQSKYILLFVVIVDMKDDLLNINDFYRK